MACLIFILTACAVIGNTCSGLSLDIGKRQFTVMLGLTLGLTECRVRGGCNETNDRKILSCGCSNYVGGMVWKKDEVILASSSNKLEIELHQSDRGNYICCVKDSCYYPTSKCSWSSNQLTTLSHLPGVDAKPGEVNMLMIGFLLILVVVAFFNGVRVVWHQRIGQRHKIHHPRDLGMHEV